MPINFVPERGRILICNYDLARIHPEIDKIRRAVVVSPRSYNHRHGAGPGRCIVVPFSGRDPGIYLSLSDIPFPAGVYQTISVHTWAVCSAVMSVSHARLDRVRVGGTYPAEYLSNQDLARIEAGLRHACGFP